MNPIAIRNLAASLLLAAAGTAGAATVTYSGSATDDVRSGMGDEIGSDNDTFVYHALSGSTSTSTTVALGTITFIVGGNCYACTLTPTYTDSIDLTINGVTQQFDLTYSWYSAGTSDYLSFGAITPVSWTIGNQVYTVNFDSLGTLSSSGPVVSENLTATITSAAVVPEPGSMALMLSGLGMGLAGLARRRAANRT